MPHSILALFIGVVAMAVGCGSGHRGARDEGSQATVARTATQDASSRPASDSETPRYADRPVAGFVRTFVESAGYEIAGDTGSAWIARGDGTSFFIWASGKSPETLLNAGTWQLAFEDSQTSIYAIDDQEVWWSTGEHVILMRPGPRGDTVLPPLSAIASLARQSKELASRS